MSLWRHLAKPGGTGETRSREGFGFCFGFFPQPEKGGFHFIHGVLGNGICIKPFLHMMENMYEHLMREFGPKAIVIKT